MQTFLIEGGLHLATSKVGVNPGTLSECLNYERSVRQGATRIEGYERFDGGPRAAFEDALLLASSGWDEAIVGDEATITVTAAGSTLVPIPVIVVNKTTGFVWINFLSASGSAQFYTDAASITDPTLVTGSLNNPAPWALLWQNYLSPTAFTNASLIAVAAGYYTLQRPLVQPVPGQGEVVAVHRFNDNLYAIRDYYTFRIDGARMYPEQGDVLTGGTSAATGVVAYVEKETGLPGVGTDLVNTANTIIVGVHSVVGTFSATEVITNTTRSYVVGNKTDDVVNARGAGMYRADGGRGNVIATQSWQHIDTGWEVAFKEGDNPFTRYDRFAEQAGIETFRLDVDKVPTDYESGGRWAVANFTDIQEDDSNAMGCQVRDWESGTHVEVTPELIVKDFGFNIPDEAFIVGIKVAIKRKASNFRAAPTADDWARDELVALTLGSENKAKVNQNLVTTTPATTPSTAEFYGGEADKWATNPSPEQINDVDFGVRLQYRFSYTEGFEPGSPKPGPFVSLFFLEVTVYYLPGSSRVYMYDGTTDVAADVLTYVTRRGTFGGSPKAQGLLSLVNIDGAREIGGEEQIRTEPLGAGTLLALTDGKAYKPVLPSDLVLQEHDNARYQFANANFFAKEGLDAMYGAHGCGSAFMWDGTYFGRAFVPIPVEDDKPRFIAAFQTRLIVGYRAGFIAVSVLQKPLVFDGVLGADEQYFSDAITNMVPLTGDALCIGTTKTIQMLQGGGPDTWGSSIIAGNSGMIEYSLLDMGEFVFCDFRGMRNISATERFGSFLPNTLSAEVWPLLSERFQLASAFEGRAKGLMGVLPVRNKRQYRMFFRDGLVMSASFVDGGPPHFYTSRYTNSEGGAIVWSVFGAGVDRSGKDRLFGSYRGASGYVFELDSGNSFDGRQIVASFTINVNDMEQPWIVKKWEYMHFHGVVKGYATVSIGRSADYEAVTATPFARDLGTPSALWTGEETARFEKSELIIEGRGISIKFASATGQQFPHTIQAVSLQAQPRGQERA